MGLGAVADVGFVLVLVVYAVGRALAVLHAGNVRRRHRSGQAYRTARYVNLNTVAAPMAISSPSTSRRSDEIRSPLT